MMETPEEVGTPITSSFKRLDVDTLVLDAGSLSGVKAEEEERRKWPFVFSPVQSLQQTAVRIHTADRDRYAPSSPLSPWPTDSRVSGQVGANRVHCRYSPYKTVQQQRQQFPSQYSGTKDRVCGRNRASSSLMRKESRSRDGTFFRSQARSRSPSVSPPLPPPPLVMDESPRSQDRTHQDFGQIPQSVCEEGAALERFLALDVAPAAQKLFDAAVVQHSKACRLLDVEHIGGLVSLDSDQEEDEHPSKRSPSRDSFKNDAKNEHASITNSSVGQNTSVASSDTVTSVNTPGASTEAWRRAVRAGVINIGSPSALTPRPSLPARKLDAYFAGAGDTCESPRWSISGRYAARKQEECSRKEFVETPKAVYEEEPTEGIRKNARVSRHEGEAAAPDERRNESCGDLTARQGRAEDSEEDDGLFSFSKQIAVDIGSKIVGLSSRIRRKAAEASQGLRNV